MQYYVIEIQNRADGNNNQTTTMRQTLRTALSYFYERCSKMVVTKLYPGVTLLLVDEQGTIYENKHLDTDYTAPETEPEQEG